MENTQKDIEEKIIIPIDGLFQEFEDHLQIKNNQRIFFSGKFGIGKSFFLNEFIKNMNDKYETFHLFPVNYQISSNENIIDLLKYDILLELLEKNSTLFSLTKKPEFKKSLNHIYAFLKEEGSVNKTLNSILTPLGNLGKPLRDLLKFDKDFQNFKEKSKKGNMGIVENHIKDIKNKDISETDSISAILNRKIKDLKEKKESVLILDDLDRIDPEHIFRILNIFSAHYIDNDEQPNKFGFDKVILVGDYNNIKNIFHHKYGQDSDFNGYFDKFFSVEIFKFDSNKIISDFVDIMCSKIKVDSKQIKKELGPEHGMGLFFVEVLKRGINLKTKGKINLRELLKPINFPLSSLKNTIRYVGREIPFKITFDISIRTLISILGGSKNRTLKMLSEIKESLLFNRDLELYTQYRVFCRLILEEALNKTIGNALQWEDYIIRKKGTKIEIVQDGGPGNEIELFYKLLIDYVKTEKYIN
jgi:KAP family P-loop domain